MRPLAVASTNREGATAEVLFEEARNAAASSDTARAERVYRTLIEQHPAASLVPMARYNLGLLLEKRAAWSDAAQQYAAIVAYRPEEPGYGRQTWRDAHYRLGACAAKAADWATAAGALLAVLGESDLEDIERLEAMVGAAIALTESGSVDAARLLFEDAVRLVRSRQRDARFDDRGFGAEAAFRLGEIATADYTAVLLAMPESSLGPLLEDKCRRLLVAQQHYVEAMAMGDAHTTAAAGFRIGSLYEALYEALVALAPPEDLDAEHVSVYRDLVAERVGVLLRKARHVYERALTVGSRASTAAPWLERLRLALDRLEGLSLSSRGQRVDSTAGVLTPAAGIAQ